MNKRIRSKEQWVDVIAHSELPALTSTARLLQKFANDDVSSLPRLSQAILHDQALSSCLLKVANSVSRIGVAPVTTVSRATVILGIQAVKNICLTSKVIDNLVKNKNLDIKVYEKIKRSMASSFFAGQLAKMMMKDYSEDTREEVYLAAMLHRIGETAFWCLGTKLNTSLANLAHLSKNELAKQSTQLLGMNFTELSLGLAYQWNLGDLLIKSLDSPEDRTIEIQIIDLADKLACYIDTPPSEQEFSDTCEKISNLMGINERQLKHRINQTRDKSLELLNSYGAQILNEHIKELPTVNNFKVTEANQSVPAANKDLAQFEAIQYLSNLTTTSTDINEFLQYTLQCLTQLLELDLCSFYLLSPTKKELMSRFSFDKAGKSIDIKKSILLERARTMLERVLLDQNSLLINSTEEQKASSFVTPEVVALLKNGKMALAPVMFKQNVVGLIIAHRFNTEVNIDDGDYSRFTFLVRHLGMCLSMLPKR